MSGTESRSLSAQEAHLPPANEAESGRSDSRDDTSAQANSPSQPVQGRRRVARACDECRRQKVKCDAKQPCMRCSMYKCECTYVKPSYRWHKPTPQYIKALEVRLQRAEALLRRFVPDTDFTDQRLAALLRDKEGTEDISNQGRGPSPERENTGLRSMVDSIGQLDLDEKGDWHFHGTSSDAVFLRRMKDQLASMQDLQGHVASLPRPEWPPAMIDLSLSRSIGSPPLDSAGAPNVTGLPPKEVARTLCQFSLGCAACLVRIVHVPSFFEWFNAIYDKVGDDLTDEERKRLALLFAVMALGCIYSFLGEAVSTEVAYKHSLEDGLKYHTYARNLLEDLTQCQDMISLQALLFVILFLQEISNLSGCYAFIGIALRSALRMGLHRHLQHEQISPVDQEVRRRVFYAILQMDVTISTLLGFPLLLDEGHIDQPYPTEVDDEYITEHGILQQPPGTSSYIEAFNAHMRLTEILKKIVKCVYPKNGTSQASTKGEGTKATYKISCIRIKEIEGELQKWYERLPEAWQPRAEGPVEAVRIRHLLRLMYGHVQLALYRPFLHYVSPTLRIARPIDDLSYACSAACISVSRNIVRAGLEMRKQTILVGSCWFMLYTEFLAVLSLLFYTINNLEKPGSSGVLDDAIAGRDMISQFAGRSISANRFASALDTLFENLSKRLKVSKAWLTRPTKERQTNAQRSVSDQAQSGQLSQTNHSQCPPNAMLLSENIHQPVYPIHGDAIPNDSFPESSFPSRLQEPPPVGLPPDATLHSTSATTQCRSLQSQMDGDGIINDFDSLSQLSDDLFPYYHQPIVELGFQPWTTTSDYTNLQPVPQFCMPDGLSGYLAGQAPLHILQEHGQPNLDSGTCSDIAVGMKSTAQSIGDTEQPSLQTPAPVYYLG